MDGPFPEATAVKPDGIKVNNLNTFQTTMIANKTSEFFF
jgi:hypothetical protein